MISARVIHSARTKRNNPAQLDLMLNADFATGLRTTLNRLSFFHQLEDKELGYLCGYQRLAQS